MLDMNKLKDICNKEMKLNKIRDEVLRIFPQVTPFPFPNNKSILEEETYIFFANDGLGSKIYIDFDVIDYDNEIVKTTFIICAEEYNRLINQSYFLK